MTPENVQIRERTPLSIIGQYLGDLNTIYGREGNSKLTEANIKPVAARDAAGHIISTAWYIDINPKADKTVFSKGSVINFFDFDDSIVETSTAKEKFVHAVAELVPQENRLAFKTAVEAFNKAARVLPFPAELTDQDLQVRHAPLLEMLAISAAYKNVMSGDTSNLPKDTDSARRFMLSTIEGSTLSGSIHLREKIIGGEKQTYLQELNETALLVGQDEGIPTGIEKNIWDIYLKEMTRPRIPENEKHHSNLPDEDLFIPATFGQPDHQLRKLISVMGQWKQNGERLPDGLLLITSGKKPPIFEEFLKNEQYPDDSLVVFVDDRLPDMTGSWIRSGRAFRPNLNSKGGFPLGSVRIDIGRASHRLARDLILFTTPIHPKKGPDALE